MASLGVEGGPGEIYMGGAAVPRSSEAHSGPRDMKSLGFVLMPSRSSSSDILSPSLTSTVLRGPEPPWPC